VKGIVLSTAVFETFGKSLPGLWSHSLGCAIASRLIARVSDLADPEEALLAGLLHDLGKAVLCHVAPKEFEQAVALAVEKKQHIGEAEQAVFGMSHAQVAGMLATAWSLPGSLSDAVEMHHLPEGTDPIHTLTAVVHVGDILTRALGLGLPGDRTMPPVNHEAIGKLGLTTEQIEAVIEGTEVEYAGSEELFGSWEG